MSSGSMWLGAAAVAAGVDWWAVARDRRRLERWMKPLTMVMLIAVTVTMGGLAGAPRALLTAGAVCGLIGDVALLGDGEVRFLTGLSAFAAGHLAYAGAALSFGFDPAWGVVGTGFMVCLLGFRFATRTVPGAHRRGGAILAGALVFYALVISAMVIASWGTAVGLAAVGASAFAVSDWVLGHRTFVGPLPGGRLGVMVPYHVGQALLVVGLTTG